MGVIVTNLFLPDLSGCAFSTGLAETIRCDLQPADPKVTYATSQVSEGCVAQVPNTNLEVHILFLEFPRVSDRWHGWVGTPRKARGDGMRGAFLWLSLE